MPGGFGGGHGAGFGDIGAIGTVSVTCKRAVDSRPVVVAAAHCRDLGAPWRPVSSAPAHSASAALTGAGAADAQHVRPGVVAASLVRPSTPLASLSSSLPNASGKGITMEITIDDDELVECMRSRHGPSFGQAVVAADVAMQEPPAALGQADDPHATEEAATSSRTSCMDSEAAVRQPPSSDEGQHLTSGTLGSTSNALAAPPAAMRLGAPRPASRRAASAPRGTSKGTQQGGAAAARCGARARAPGGGGRPPWSGVGTAARATSSGAIAAGSRTRVPATSPTGVWPVSPEGAASVASATQTWSAAGPALGPRKKASQPQAMEGSRFPSRAAAGAVRDPRWIDSPPRSRNGRDLLGVVGGCSLPRSEDLAAQASQLGSEAGAEMLRESMHQLTEQLRGIVHCLGQDDMFASRMGVGADMTQGVPDAGAGMEQEREPDAAAADDVPAWSARPSVDALMEQTQREVGKILQGVSHLEHAAMRSSAELSTTSADMGVAMQEAVVLLERLGCSESEGVDPVLPRPQAIAGSPRDPKATGQKSPRPQSTGASKPGPAQKRAGSQPRQPAARPGAASGARARSQPSGQRPPRERPGESRRRLGLVGIPHTEPGAALGGGDAAIGADVAPAEAPGAGSSSAREGGAEALLGDLVSELAADGAPPHAEAPTSAEDQRKRATGWYSQARAQELITEIQHRAAQSRKAQEEKERRRLGQLWRLESACRSRVNAFAPPPSAKAIVPSVKEAARPQGAATRSQSVPLQAAAAGPLAASRPRSATARRAGARPSGGAARGTRSRPAAGAGGVVGRAAGAAPRRGAPRRGGLASPDSQGPASTRPQGRRTEVARPGAREIVEELLMNTDTEAPASRGELHGRQCESLSDSGEVLIPSRRRRDARLAARIRTATLRRARAARQTIRQGSQYDAPPHINLDMDLGIGGIALPDPIEDAGSMDGQWLDWFGPELPSQSLLSAAPTPEFPSSRGPAFRGWPADTPPPDMMFDAAPPRFDVPPPHMMCDEAMLSPRPSSRAAMPSASWLTEDDRRVIDEVLAEQRRRRGASVGEPPWQSSGSGSQVPVSPRHAQAIVPVRPPSRGGESWQTLGQTTPPAYEQVLPEHFQQFEQLIAQPLTPPLSPFQQTAFPDGGSSSEFGSHDGFGNVFGQTMGRVGDFSQHFPDDGGSAHGRSYIDEGFPVQPTSRSVRSGGTPFSGRSTPAVTAPTASEPTPGTSRSGGAIREDFDASAAGSSVPGMGAERTRSPAIGCLSGEAVAEEVGDTVGDSPKAGAMSTAPAEVAEVAAIDMVGGPRQDPLREAAAAAVAPVDVGGVAVPDPIQDLRDVCGQDHLELSFEGLNFQGLSCDDIRGELLDRLAEMGLNRLQVRLHEGSIVSFHRPFAEVDAVRASSLGVVKGVGRKAQVEGDLTPGAVYAAAAGTIVSSMSPRLSQDSDAIAFADVATGGPPPDVEDASLLAGSDAGHRDAAGVADSSSAATAADPRPAALPASAASVAAAVAAVVASASTPPPGPQLGVSASSSSSSSTPSAQGTGSMPARGTGAIPAAVSAAASSSLFHSDMLGLDRIVGSRGVRGGQRASLGRAPSPDVGPGSAGSSSAMLAAYGRTPQSEEEGYVSSATSASNIGLSPGRSEAALLKDMMRHSEHRNMIRKLIPVFPSPEDPPMQHGSAPSSTRSLLSNSSSSSSAAASHDRALETDGFTRFTYDLAKRIVEEEQVRATMVEQLFRLQQKALGKKTREKLRHLKFIEAEKSPRWIEKRMRKVRMRADAEHAEIERQIAESKVFDARRKLRLSEMESTVYSLRSDTLRLKRRVHSADADTSAVGLASVQGGGTEEAASSSAAPPRLPLAVPAFPKPIACLGADSSDRAAAFSGACRLAVPAAPRGDAAEPGRPEATRALGTGSAAVVAASASWQVRPRPDEEWQARESHLEKLRAELAEKRHEVQRMQAEREKQKQTRKEQRLLRELQRLDSEAEKLRKPLESDEDEPSSGDSSAASGIPAARSQEGILHEGATGRHPAPGARLADPSALQWPAAASARPAFEVASTAIAEAAAATPPQGVHRHGRTAGDRADLHEGIDAASVGQRVAQSLPPRSSHWHDEAPAWQRLAAFSTVLDDTPASEGTESARSSGVAMDVLAGEDASLFPGSGRASTNSSDTSMPIEESEVGENRGGFQAMEWHQSLGQPLRSTRVDALDSGGPATFVARQDLVDETGPESQLSGSLGGASGAIAPGGEPALRHPTPIAPASLMPEFIEDASSVESEPPAMPPLGSPRTAAASSASAAGTEVGPSADVDAPSSLEASATPRAASGAVDKAEASSLIAAELLDTLLGEVWSELADRSGVAPRGVAAQPKPPTITPAAGAATKMDFFWDRALQLLGVESESDPVVLPLRPTEEWLPTMVEDMMKQQEVGQPLAALGNNSRHERDLVAFVKFLGEVLVEIVSEEVKVGPRNLGSRRRGSGELSLAARVRAKQREKGLALKPQLTWGQVRSRWFDDVRSGRRIGDVQSEDARGADMELANDEAWIRCDEASVHNRNRPERLMDALLDEEISADEARWLDSADDYKDVKNQVVQLIFSDLIDETAMELQSIWNG